MSSLPANKLELPPARAKRAPARPRQSAGLTKRDLQKSRTRRVLLQAGREVYATRGFDAPTIEDVTRAAGVSRAAFYLHFASREEHMLAIFEREVRWQFRLFRSLTGADLRDQASAIAWVERYIERAKPELRYMPIIWRTLSNDPGLARNIEEQREYVMRKLAHRVPELRLLLPDGSFDMPAAAEMGMIMIQLDRLGANIAYLDRPAAFAIANTARRLLALARR